MIRRGSSGLVESLRKPGCYPHPVEEVKVLETHASSILLTGAFAYKIKKPVNLGFLDFTTIGARRFYCEEELRINRRTAPDVYLDVLPITGTEAAPVVGGAGPAIEYAVRMRQFPQEALLDRIARAGGLSSRHVDLLAQGLARFHERAARAAPDSTHGSAEAVGSAADQNFEQMQPIVEEQRDIARLSALRAWTLSQSGALAGVFNQRKQAGFVRECHGDLHLGNIALLAGVPTPFDGIEFSADFRWIDVMSDIAFLVMDLHDHGLPALAWRLLNRYLEVSGDFAGLGVLRFYCVYRALVRAKVSRIRARQPDVAAPEKDRSMQEYRRLLGLAERLAGRSPVAMILMHGLSGSGKTVAAQALLEELGAIRIRSDIERRRTHGIAESARSGAGINSGIYSPTARMQIYSRMRAIAQEVLAAGYTVIADAAFLQRPQRELFRSMARSDHIPLAIVSCHARAESLRRRVALREQSGEDASEAGIAVLENQLATQDPLDDEEMEYWIEVDTESGDQAFDRAAKTLARRLFQRAL